MFWWDWALWRKSVAFALMAGIAAVPWLLLGWFPEDLDAHLGGTLFLMSPMIFGWYLFVAFRTRRIPIMYRDPASLDESPLAFWLTTLGYAGMVAIVLAAMAIVLVSE